MQAAESDPHTYDVSPSQVGPGPVHVPGLSTVDLQAGNPATAWPASAAQVHHSTADQDAAARIPQRAAVHHFAAHAAAAHVDLEQSGMDTTGQMPGTGRNAAPAAAEAFGQAGDEQHTSSQHWQQNLTGMGQEARRAGVHNKAEGSPNAAKLCFARYPTCKPDMPRCLCASAWHVHKPFLALGAQQVCNWVFVCPTERGQSSDCVN